jgi:hypothetical protein
MRNVYLARVNSTVVVEETVDEVETVTKEEAVVGIVVVVPFSPGGSDMSAQGPRQEAGGPS